MHDPACPACGGNEFQAAYLVRSLQAVRLTRCRRSGEVLIGRPGVSVTPAPAPSFRDFDELRCMACGARLDWELDHRSLYELDRRV